MSMAKAMMLPSGGPVTEGGHQYYRIYVCRNTILQWQRRPMGRREWRDISINYLLAGHILSSTIGQQCKGFQFFLYFRRHKSSKFKVLL